MYKLISILINTFSYIFLFTKKSYDIVLIQKFGFEKSINYILIENELKDLRIKYINSNSNELKNIILDIYYTSKSNITILDAYSLGISNTKRFKNKKIIQIWHALGAIKKFGFQSLDTDNGRSSKQAYGLSMHKNYSFAVSPSKITTPIFEEAFNCNVKEFKLPIIDFYKAQAQLTNNNKILYLPTYRENSSKGITSVMNTLKDKYEITYKPHINDLKNVSNINYKQCNISTFDALKDCDILITDYSAAAFEAALLGKYVIFYLWDYEQYIIERGINMNFDTMYNVCYSEEELVKVLDNLHDSSYITSTYLNAEDDFIEYLKLNI